MAYEITWEAIRGGYAAFLGERKLAVLGTTHDQGLVRNNQIIYEAMPRDQWGIHFTSPAMSLALVSAILASVPTGALPQ